LFSVGGTQLKAMLELELDAGGGVAADVVEPEVVEPFVGAWSATVAGVVAVVLAAFDIPESSLPHPASASAVLPNNVKQTKRPTRAAFGMLTPTMASSSGQGEVIIRRLHERAAQLQRAFTHEADASAPATPLS
jgi:hypothetical protein